MKKVLLLTLVVLMGFAVTVYGAYGYFDASKNTSYVRINIGEWQAIVNETMDYLNKSDTYSPNGNNVRFLKEIADLIWSDTQYDNNGNIISGSLNERFQKYSTKQLKDVIDSAVKYVKDYLQVDANGEIFYPADASGVGAKVLPYNTPLVAGQSIQIHSTILTADLETSSNNSWEPMTYYISMESPSGADIADYALEVLYAPPFSTPDAFNYTVRFSDPNSYNTYGSTRTVSRENIVFHPVTEQTYTTEVYRKNTNNKNYSSKLYRHTLIAPEGSMWSRFEGLNMFVGEPKGSPLGNQQLFEQANNKPNREGMILIGKPNGTPTELRLSIFSRNVNYGPIGIIPLQINVSRGVELANNGNPLNEGQTTNVFPTIKVRAVKGYIL